jgi:hypothetical protein
MIRTNELWNTNTIKYERALLNVAGYSNTNVASSAAIPYGQYDEALIERHKNINPMSPHTTARPPDHRPAFVSA